MRTQESPLREGWYSYLKPYQHYVPVRQDMSDLIPQLEWAFANRTRLRGIAHNGAQLAMRHLSRRAVLCHWIELLRRLGEHTRPPVEISKHARRHPPTRPNPWPPALHEPFQTNPFNPLRPHITHAGPLRRADVEALAADIHPTPCVGMTWTHLCVDM